MVTRSGILRHTLPVSMLRKPSTVNQDIRTISTSDECSSLWLMQYLKARSKELLLEYGKTGTTVESVDFAKMQSMSLLLPKASEQGAIGDLFYQLDNLITLHQRKYDKLVVLKKALLDKMFPRDGSDVPEIRFAGFTDPWEQRKLGDYLELSTERNSELRYGVEDVYSVSWTSGVVNQIEFQGRSFAGTDLSGYDVVHHNEVIYTKSPLRDEPFGIIKTNHLTSGIVSQLYAVYQASEECDPSFVETYFAQNTRLNNYFRPLVNKGAKNTMNISDEESLTGPVTFPSAAEQRKIASLFSFLDDLITLHQRKLKLLKSVKTSLLEKMFV